MKLTIFAATGGVGTQLLEQAVAAGHDVTAVARNPRRVVTVTADLATADPADLEPALVGADAVLSGLGPHSNADAGIASSGTRSIVSAMQATGRRRIVVVSAAPVSTVPSPGNPHPPKHDPGDGFAMRHLLTRIATARFGKVYEDLALMEDTLRDSGLDWTVIRPPQLTDKPRSSTYRTALGQNLPGGLSVARADVADLMLSPARTRDSRADHRHRQPAVNRSPRQADHQLADSGEIALPSPQEDTLTTETQTTSSHVGKQIDFS